MDDSELKGHDASRITGLIRLMRPRQWIKNGFVLAPLLFTGRFWQADRAGQALLAALLFCLASSAVYIVNDWRDAERDRQHPVKRRERPLASGAVTPRMALALLLALRDRRASCRERCRSRWSPYH